MAEGPAERPGEDPGLRPGPLEGSPARQARQGAQFVVGLSGGRERWLQANEPRSFASPDQAGPPPSLAPPRSKRLRPVITIRFTDLARVSLERRFAVELPGRRGRRVRT